MIEEQDKKKIAEISQNTQFKANLAFAIKVIAIVATAVWTYSAVVNRLSTLEMNMVRLEQQIEMNSQFRVKWPRGELGSLPADARQDLLLENIEKRLEAIDVMRHELNEYRVQIELLRERETRSAQ